MTSGLANQDKSIVLVGLMGAGKTCIGRRLARRLGMTFIDADEEIVKAAGASVSEIFRRYGESAFRDGERRVIARLLHSRSQVLAIGGGAFIELGDSRADSGAWRFRLAARRTRRAGEADEGAGRAAAAGDGRSARDLSQH